MQEKKNSEVENVEEVKAEGTVKTPGGMDAFLVNEMFIRQSYKPQRLIDDGETYQEYTVRRELLNQNSKKRGALIHISSFNDGKRIIKNPNPYVKEESK